MTRRDIIISMLEIAREEISIELKAQGHDSSGQLVGSIETKINETIEGMRGELYMAYYYEFVNNFTPPSKIPFGGRSGRGGKSKYIEGLISFFTRLAAQNPISRAFATAYTQKKEGRPTKGSYLFSSNGRRTGFLEAAHSKIAERGLDKIAEDYEKYILTEVFKVAA